ncbi:MAG TPA: prepilin-type N-terminal cleavage/methylation domain-containing protein [Micromonosporaceae bacterium]|nr:prepilin-type N-terminal cleavage/methylation domain-containing protein [Micromonosporaceae bacterium]
MLRQRIREIRKNDKGFTLIELLIVIIILGVLAGIVVFAVAAFNDRGVEAACKSDVTTVEVAVEAYRAKTGTYPATMAALVTAGYMKSVPSSTEYFVTLTVNNAATPPSASVTGNLGTVAAPGAACKA